jgi:predicted Zn-dependent peptidase
MQTNRLDTLPKFQGFPVSTPVVPSFPATWQALPTQKRVMTSPFGYPLTLYTLPNGHRIMVEQRPTDVVSLRTFVGTGSILEDGTVASALYRNLGLPPGIAHLDEHAHFVTTEHFPLKNSWRKTLDSYGVYANAHTEHESVNHEILVNREDLAPILKLHAEMVLHPIYTADVQQEKNAVTNEIARLDRHPDFRVFSETQRLVFDRPYRQVGGSPQAVNATTPEQMRQFYNLAYTPTHMLTVVSGHVDPEMILNSLAPEFGANPPRNIGVGNQGLQVTLRPNEIRTATVTDPQLTNSLVSIGFPAPSSGNYQERIAMEFLKELLCGDATSLLPEEVVNRQQIALLAQASQLNFKQAGMFQVMLTTPPGREQAALASTLNVIGRLAQTPVSEQTLAQIRDRLIQDFRSRRNDVAGGTKLLGEEGVKNTLLYYQQYVPLANLVRPDDIMAVARKYLDPNRYAVVFGVGGPGPAGGPRG